MSCKRILLILLSCFIPIRFYATLITLSGNPSPLIITRATAGQEPFKVTDTSTTYSIKVPHQKIVTLTGSLDSPMNAYTTLKINISSPQKGNTHSLVALDCIPRIIVEGITEGFHENLLITYEYTAKVAAGVLPLCSKTIILTVLESEAHSN